MKAEYRTQDKYCVLPWFCVKLGLMDKSKKYLVRKRQNDLR